eukprot:c10181_g1_i1.p1 GENE.c10181_g1_i1~~c10181_g1_i1.p1  ORF type:complete len:286 (+),score=51.20 c10181_g1_i1:187-1044(+)
MLEALELFLGPLVYVPGLLIEVLGHVEFRKLLPNNSNLLVLANSALVVTLVFVCVGLISPRGDVADLLWGLGWSSISAYHMFRYKMFKFVRSWIFVFVAFVYAVRHVVRSLKRLLRKSDSHLLENNNRFTRILHIFLPRAVILSLCTVPMMLGHTRKAEMDICEYISIFCFTVGFYFAWVGDSDLAEHFSNSKNHDKLCVSGVRQLIRHPHELGEVTCVFSFFVFSLGAGLERAGLLGLIGALAHFTWTRYWVVKSKDQRLEQRFATMYRKYRLLIPAVFPNFGM